MAVLVASQTEPPVVAASFDIGSPDQSVQLLEIMTELFARYGDIFRVYSPARKSYIYVIRNPDDVKRLMLSNHRNYTKGIGVDRVRLLLGNGILTSEGDFWHRQRTMMQPMFHRQIIASFAQVIDEENARLLERWAEISRDGKPINLTEEMSELTLQIVLRAIFGSDLERMSDESGGNPFLIFTREQARDIQFAQRFYALKRVLAALIARRRASSEEHFDYVSMLMSARDKETGAAMGERELIDEIMTLVVSGHETTANGLIWTWYLLSQHPEVESRLHSEVDSIPVTSGAPADTSPSERERLVYTRQVIDEALRLYPPGWLLSRRTIDADVLSGYDIPGGADILLPLYHLHRHPHSWPNPEAFLPERFAPDREPGRSKFAYMPFAGGPRHCIGESLALEEMRMHLHRVARRFRLVHVADKPLVLEPQINLRTRDPILMRLEPR